MVVVVGPWEQVLVIRRPGRRGRFFSARILYFKVYLQFLSLEFALWAVLSVSVVERFDKAVRRD